jgi:amidase
VGLKPTPGLVSRNSVVPTSPTQDSIGPIARTVYDAACMLTAMAGPDKDDKKTAECPFVVIPDYCKCADEANVSGMRIGVPRNAFGDVPDFILEPFNHAVSQLREAGVDVVEFDLPCMKRYHELKGSKEDFSYLAAEFNVALEGYLSNLKTNPNNITSMQSIIDFTKRTPEENYPERDVVWLERSANLDYQSPEYVAGLRDSAIFAGKDGIKGVLETHRLDALLVPSAADAPNYCASRAGLPVISVPLGYRPETAPVVRNLTKQLIISAPHIP